MSLIKTNGYSKTKSLLPRTSFFNSLLDFDWPIIEWSNDIGFNSDWIPAANVKEGDKEFTVELSVPGYTKKDIHVEVDNNNVLRVTGERKEEVNEEKDNYTRREFSYGSLSRTFQLPETVKAEEIAATCKEGVLTVVLPKKETAVLKRKTKEIEIA